MKIIKGLANAAEGAEVGVSITPDFVTVTKYLQIL